MPCRPLRIVIPGGSGQLGHLLARHFHEQGHFVTSVARHAKPAEWPTLSWNAAELGPWANAIDGSDVVINLAGRSVNCRYTEANRREIKNSRTITTGLVGQAIATAKAPPPLWLNASTCTIYRHSVDRAMDDLTGELGGHEPDAPRSWDFSIDVAQSWERALFAADTPRTRRIAMRCAMVMSPDPGGIFDSLLRMVRFGLGGTAGPGNQFVSWVHDHDFIRAVEHLIQRNDLDGAVNICSPCPIPNSMFMRCLRQAWCTTYVGLPEPTWMLEIGAIFLRTETELILKSRRVVPRRLLDSGFEFHFPNWRAASQNLVTQWRRLSND
jgi:uncharacterized protein (TIGR01777 family)